MHVISVFIPLFELNAKISKHPVSKGDAGDKKPEHSFPFLSIPATFDRLLTDVIETVAIFIIYLFICGYGLH